MHSVPQRGDFVRVRSRRWLVEDERPIDGLKTLRLACVDDDAQFELAEAQTSSGTISRIYELAGLSRLLARLRRAVRL
jgi:hypothetical protein